jgi:hypothetical protein
VSFTAVSVDGDHGRVAGNAGHRASASGTVSGKPVMASELLTVRYRVIV